MRAYIIKIVGATILAVFGDMLSPPGWKKYIGIVSSLILMSVIVTPVAEIKGIDITSGYEDTQIADDGTMLYSSMLKQEFSKNIALDVKERILSEFSVDASVEAEVNVDDNGNIANISKIKITGENLTDEIKARISYIYDVDEVVINAA